MFKQYKDYIKEYSSQITIIDDSDLLPERLKSMAVIIDKLLSSGMNAHTIYKYIQMIGVSKSDANILANYFEFDMYSPAFENFIYEEDKVDTSDLEDVLKSDPKDIVSKKVKVKKQKDSKDSDDEIETSVKKLEKSKDSKNDSDELDSDSDELDSESDETPKKSDKSATAMLQSVLRDAEKLEKIKKIINEQNSNYYD